jgi:hypothetical protein
MPGRTLSRLAEAHHIEEKHAATPRSSLASGSTPSGSSGTSGAASSSVEYSSDADASPPDRRGKTLCWYRRDASTRRGGQTRRRSGPGRVTPYQRLPCRPFGTDRNRHISCGRLARLTVQTAARSHSALPVGCGWCLTTHPSGPVTPRPTPENDEPNPGRQGWGLLKEIDCS